MTASIELIKPLRRAKTAVSMSAQKKVLYVFLVDCNSFRLSVWTVRSTYDWTYLALATTMINVSSSNLHPSVDRPISNHHIISVLHLVQSFFDLYLPDEVESVRWSTGQAGN